MIQGIGIAFIRNSKYLFIRKSIEILRKRYTVDMYYLFISLGISNMMDCQLSVVQVIYFSYKNP